MVSRNVIDVRGLPCPQPVIQTRNAMKFGLSITVQVSQPDQVENVSRMAQRAGWTVESRSMDHSDEPFYEILLTPGTQNTEPEVTEDVLTCHPADPAQPGLVVIASESMGQGDQSLGKLLMKAFLSTILELDQGLPGKIIMFNSGVKLAIKESPVIETLKEIQQRGVEILVCGTCLDFYGVKEELAVGHVSNMFDIAGAMSEKGIIYIS